MKKILFFLVTALLFISFSFCFANDPPPPLPYPDCLLCPDHTTPSTIPPCSTSYRVPFTGNYSYSWDGYYCHALWTLYQDGQTCYFDVNFQVRTICCGTQIIKEILINQIEISANCVGMDYSSILRGAIQCVLQEASVCFDVFPPPPYWNVTVNIASCWKYNTIGTPPTSFWLAPCENSHCCKTNYSVSIQTDANGSYFNVDNVNIISTDAGSCSLTGQSCNNYCSVNSSIQTGRLTNPAPNTCSTNDPCQSVPWSRVPKTVTFYPAIGAEFFPTFIYRSVSVQGENFWAYVSYKTCPTIPVQKHIRIERILLNPALAADGNYTDYDILLNAVQSALKNANGYFDNYTTPPPYHSDILGPDHNRQNDNYPKLTYYIDMPECWHRDGNWLVPCDLNTCCSVGFDITFDLNCTLTDILSCYNESKQVTWHNNIRPGHNSDVCGNGCENECDVLNDPFFSLRPPYGPSLPRISEQTLENAVQGYLPSISLKPNPADESIEIKFTSEFQGYADLNISDNKGETIYKTSMNKSSSDLTYKLDTKTYTPGVYFINISINGNRIIGDKFIISR